MEKRPKLVAQKRKVFGKKVKKLRKEGLIPAHVYGKGVKSIHISVDGKTFLPVFEEVGETGLVDLVVDKQKPRTVLISQVQRHPVTDQPLHVDLHQVALTEKVKAEIPIEIVGKSPAVEEKKGVLLTILGKVEVEALPADLPENIPVHISNLAEVDNVVKVADLKVGKKISVLTNPEEILVKIGPLVTAEVEEEIKAEKAAAEAEAAAEEAKKTEEEPKEAPRKGKPEGETTPKEAS